MVDISSLSFAAVAAALTPWLALAAFLTFGIRQPRPLPGAAGSGGRWEASSEGAGPLVSVIVPARNEARFIVGCLGSLGRLKGVPYEVVVVDDRSTDGTAGLARAVPQGNARELRVIEGGALPNGWFGKPWACHQGARAARGRLLLFTDADTTHHPDLLARALAAMSEDQAQAVSVMGRQELGTFAERLVQPQIFLLMGIRFRRLDRVLGPERWQEAIANGQYILVEREPYEDIGGHETVRDEVAEDLRLAQELTRAGFRLSVRSGLDVLSTRMYTSLRELVDGWTKNVAVGARQAAGRWGASALPAMAGFLVVAWLLPPAVLATALGGRVLGAWSVDPNALWWAALTGAVSVLVWAAGYRRFDVSARYAVLYPLGAAVALFIVLRSGIRGARRIEWKGRRYRGSTVEEGG